MSVYDNSVHIHPTAIVEKGAELEEGVIVGPYAIIGANVKIGKGTHIQSHALIQGHTIIGQYNNIYSFSSVGNPPQDLKYKGEKTILEIGDRNIIREYATLQPGTIQGGGLTKVGSDNLLMAYTHVAHDCLVGNLNVIANGTQLAGHVTVENMAIVGGLTAVHQFSRIGTLAMIGGGTVVIKDIPPYCNAEGNRAVIRGMNLEGMRRRNISPEIRTKLKDAFKVAFLKKYSAVEEMHAALEPLCNIPEVKHFVDFIKTTKRGISQIGKYSKETNNNE